MERGALDSLEYESTYLELRPNRERLMTTPAPVAVPAPQAERAPVSPSTTPTAPPVLSADLRSDRAPGAADPLTTPSASRITHSPRWSALPPLGFALASATVAYAAERDPQAARILLMILSGAALYGWARMAWRAPARRGPLGYNATRALDRLVTLLGTLFAVMLWATYLPQVSGTFSRAAVIVLCGPGLTGGLIAAARDLRP